MRSCRRAAAGLALAGMSLAPAAAAPLLETDDADVMAAGECEAETSLTLIRANGRTTRETELGVGCGVGWRSQIDLGAGWTQPPGGDRERSAALGGKTALATWGEQGPALAVGWEVAAEHLEGRWRHAGQGLALLYSVPWGGGALHANLGHARERLGRVTATRWGLVYASAVREVGALGWSARAEVAGDDHGGLGWALGLQLSVVPDRVVVDIVHGRPVGPSGARQWGLGFTLAF